MAEDLGPGKTRKDLGKYSFREWKLPVKLVAGSHELKVRATNNAGRHPANEPLWNPAGYMRNVVETVASPRHEGNSHDTFDAPRGCRIAGLALGFGQRSPGDLHDCRRNRCLQPGPDLETVQNNCTACHSADYINTQPRGLKKDFWAGRSDEDDQVYGARSRMPTLARSSTISPQPIEDVSWPEPRGRRRVQGAR